MNERFRCGNSFQELRANCGFCFVDGAGDAVAVKGKRLYGYKVAILAFIGMATECSKVPHREVFAEQEQ